MAINTRICKTSDIEGYNSIVTMDYWCENMWCAKLIRKELWLYDLGMINTFKAVKPNDDLTKLLEPKTVPWGNHAVNRNNNYEGETYFMVYWKGKINHVKGKKLNKKLTTTMLFTNFSTTLPIYPATQHRHNLDWGVYPTIFFVNTKVYKPYYRKNFTTDTIRVFWKGVLNI